jgi:branched-chain amino acid transport system permease protein
MGVRDVSYKRGLEFVVDRPFSALLVFVGLYVLADVSLKFLGLEMRVGGIQLLGGYVRPSSFISKLINGVLRGLVIGLTGIGLSMTYSILNFANFAHGDYITAGAFAGTATSYVVAGGLGLASYDIGTLVLVGPERRLTASSINISIASTPLAVVAGLLVAGLATVGIALLIDRWAFLPIRERSGITLLITSVGVAFILRYLIRFVYGVNKRSTYDRGSTPEWAFAVGNGIVKVDAHDVLLFVLGVGLMLGVHLLLQTTKLGKAMRAMSDNKDLARITGIPTERVIRFTWIVGGGLTGVAGYTWVLWRGTFGWFDGWLFLLLIFAAVILGGIGSIYGAMAGGLIIGLTRDLSTIYVSSTMARAAAFALMILILVVKPSGLFSGRSTA